MEAPELSFTHFYRMQRVLAHMRRLYPYTTPPVPFYLLQFEDTAGPLVLIESYDQ